MFAFLLCLIFSTFAAPAIAYKRSYPHFDYKPEAFDASETVPESQPRYPVAVRHSHVPAFFDGDDSEEQTYDDIKKFASKVAKVVSLLKEAQQYISLDDLAYLLKNKRAVSTIKKVVKQTLKELPSEYKSLLQFDADEDEMAAIRAFNHQKKVEFFDSIFHLPKINPAPKA